MRDYVLSTYITPAGPRAFTTARHDQGVALWRVHDDRIVLARYWELERQSGMKHHEYPLYEDEAQVAGLLTRLLAQEGLGLGDVGEIWGTPGVGGASLPPGVDRQGLPVHSLAHLFSGLCLDAERFRDSTIVALAVDGGPDFTLEDEVVNERWYAGAVSRRGEVSLAPVESPGALWQAAHVRFGMEPGTLMAIASATPVELEYDLDGILRHRYWGGPRIMHEAHAIVGAVVDAAEAAVRARATSGCGFTAAELVAGAAMKVVQEASIAIVRRGVDALLERGAVEPADAYLSLAGGCALNCPTNSRLLTEYGFRGLLAPPCANDSGQALGIGLLGFFARGDLASRRVDLRLPYAGTGRLDVAGAMRRWGRGILDVTDFDEATFVADVQAAPVAWVDGEAEVGPRALGHRSLLGDPRRLETKQLLNRVKQRQWWRPVAPIVLEECAADWFVNGRPSPFMLETLDVVAERRRLVPAIVHLDGSARIQTLSAAGEPFLHRAVSAFHRATGVPIVCNTSLNDRGEPIVDNAAEALNFCFRKGIRVAYLERRRYLLDVDRGATAASGPEPRPLAALYTGQEPRPPAVYGDDVDPEVMYLLYVWPGLHRFAGGPGGASRLRSIARHVARRDGAFPERAKQFVAYWRRMLEGTIAQGQVDVR